MTFFRIGAIVLVLGLSACTSPKSKPPSETVAVSTIWLPLASVTAPPLMFKLPAIAVVPAVLASVRVPAFTVVTPV